MVSPRLSISLVLYKDEPPLLQRCLECIRASQLPLHIYAVDNSPTNRLQAVCAGPDVSYVHGGENVGFGRAHNRALREGPRADYHLVLNSDISFSPEVLPRMLTYMDDHPDIGLLAPKVCFPNGQVQYLCKLYPSVFILFARRFLPRFLQRLCMKSLERYEMRETGYDKVMEVSFLSGCFMLLRRKHLDETGPFDEKIFLYFEDWDLSYRMSKKHRTVFYPEVTVLHEWHRGSYKSLLHTWLNIKSALYFFSKHGWKVF
jgi:GT2 family glycosyltransferase